MSGATAAAAGAQDFLVELGTEELPPLALPEKGLGRGGLA